MQYVKCFIAGMILPATLLPFFVLFNVIFWNVEVVGLVSIHILPLLWGGWNVLYFTTFRNKLPGNRTIRLVITGVALGLLVSVYGVFILGLPEMMGVPEMWQSFPLLGVPVLYGVLWWAVVGRLNTLMGLDDL